MNALPHYFESTENINLDLIQDILSDTKKISTNSYKKMSNFPYFVSTFFEENSTRTLISFQAATLNLGLKLIDFPIHKSSLEKGEDIVENFNNLYHLGIRIVAYRCSRNIFLQPSQLAGIPKDLYFINGGSGTSCHPTQALGDLYTLQEFFPDLNKCQIAIVGDLKHSRVAHSLCDLLPRFGVNVHLVSPAQFRPDELLEKNSSLTWHANFTQSLYETCNALYLLRVQRERHVSELNNLNHSADFHFNLERIKKFKIPPHVFHPGPINIGVEMSEDLIRSKYFQAYKQVQNSTYVRMSLINKIANIL